MAQNLQSQNPVELSPVALWNLMYYYSREFCIINPSLIIQYSSGLGNVHLGAQGQFKSIMLL